MAVLPMLTIYEKLERVIPVENQMENTIPFGKQKQISQ